MSLFVSIFVVIFSFKLLELSKCSVNPLKINVVSYLFYVPFICMALIGSVCVEYGIYGNDALLLSAISPTINFKVLITVLYCLFFYSFSACLSSRITTNLIGENAKTTTSTHQSDKNILFCVIFLCLMASLYVYTASGYIGLFVLFSDIDMAQARALWVYGKDVNPYIKNIFATILSIYLSYLLYAYTVTSKNKSYKVWFYVLLVNSILLLSMSFSKSPLALYLFSYLFLYVLFNKKVSLKQLFCFCVLPLLFLVLYYLIFGSKFNIAIGDVIKSIMSRIFFSQIASAYKGFELFPNSHPFLGVVSISPLISRLVGAENIIDYGRLIYQLSLNTNINSLAGGAVSLFFVEAWCCYGTVGLLLSPFLVGSFNGSLDCVIRNSTSLEYKALYGCFFFFNPFISSFNQYLFPLWMILPFIFAYILKNFKLNLSYVKLDGNG